MSNEESIDLEDDENPTVVPTVKEVTEMLNSVSLEAGPKKTGRKKKDVPTPEEVSQMSDK